MKLLGKDGGLGYDVCYVSPPPFMLDDIQTNAEYIANAMYAPFHLSHSM